MREYNVYPAINSYEDIAIDTVISVINKAKEKLGERMNLMQLAQSRKVLETYGKVALGGLKDPLPVTAVKFLENVIEKHWYMSRTFSHTLNFLGGMHTENSKFYYYEAIFSQPTAAYPIPQATASVFFRIQDKLMEPIDMKVPSVVFRVEGTYTDHDLRCVTLNADWLLALLKMKIKIFQKVEEINMF